MGRRSSTTLIDLQILGIKMSNPHQTKLIPMFSFSVAIVSLTVCFATTGSAQERSSFDEGFDQKMAVTFEDPTPSEPNRTSSSDGRLLAEAEYKKIRVYSVESKKLLHEFSTSGNTNAPLFTADGTKLIAAVCRGNLGCISTLYSWDLETGERTRLGECSGLVMDVCTDANATRVAVSTYYGDIFSMVLAQSKRKWFGGEIVVFDTAKPKQSVRIFCELVGVPGLEGFAKDANDSEQLADKMKQRLAEANYNCLPIRVGLTPDGGKVIGVTATGVMRLFDANTGKPELILSAKSRFGDELFGMSQQ